MSRLSLSALLWLILGQPAIVMAGAMLWTLGNFIYIITFLSVDTGSATAHATKESIGVMAANALAIGGILIISRIFSWLLALFVAGWFLRLKGKVSFWVLFTLAPVCALLLCFGYDRLIPDYRFMNDTRTPYEHGLTWGKLGIAWIIELAVMLVYWFPIREFKAGRPMAKPNGLMP